MTKCYDVVTPSIEELDEAIDLILDMFRQHCLVASDDGKFTDPEMYDHMCTSTYEYAQAYLIKHGKIKLEQCKRKTPNADFYAVWKKAGRKVLMSKPDKIKELLEAFNTASRSLENVQVLLTDLGAEDHAEIAHTISEDLVSLLSDVKGEVEGGP